MSPTRMASSIGRLGALRSANMPMRVGPLIGGTVQSNDGSRVSHPRSLVGVDGWLGSAPVLSCAGLQRVSGCAGTALHRDCCASSHPSAATNGWLGPALETSPSGARPLCCRIDSETPLWMMPRQRGALVVEIRECLEVSKSVVCTRLNACD